MLDDFSERIAIGKSIEERIGNRQGQRTDIEPEPKSKKQLTLVTPETELSQKFDEVKGRSDEIAAKKAGFVSYKIDIKQLPLPLSLDDDLSRGGAVSMG